MFVSTAADVLEPLQLAMRSSPRVPLPLRDTDGALCDHNVRVACASRPAVTRLSVRMERRDISENPAYTAFNPVPCGVLPTAQGARAGILCYALGVNVRHQSVNP
jgi:hypothetical protein